METALLSQCRSIYGSADEVNHDGNKTDETVQVSFAPDFYDVSIWGKNNNIVKIDFDQKSTTFDDEDLEHVNGRLQIQLSIDEALKLINDIQAVIIQNTVRKSAIVTIEQNQS